MTDIFETGNEQQCPLRKTRCINTSQLFPLQPKRSLFVCTVYLAQRCAWLQPSERQTEKCSLLYVRLPASSSIVNTACVVYGNVGHLFVVLLGVRPQVKVDDNRVHTAGLSISLLHQLVETVFDQLHAPNGTTSDLYFSPVS